MENPSLQYTKSIDKLFRQFNTQPIKLKFLCSTQKNNTVYLEIPVAINKQVFTAMINSRAQGNYISPSIVNQE